MREIEKKVCVSRIVSRLNENSEWWLRAIGGNGKDTYVM